VIPFPPTLRVAPAAPNSGGFFFGSCVRFLGVFCTPEILSPPASRGTTGASAGGRLWEWLTIKDLVGSGLNTMFNDELKLFHVKHKKLKQRGNIMQKQVKQTTVRLSEWEYSQLQAIAEVENRRINQVIIDAIYEYAYQQHEEAKNFLHSVDAGMLKPSTENSQKHLQRLYQAFSARFRVTKPMYEQRLLEEEYSEPTDNMPEE